MVPICHKTTTCQITRVPITDHIATPLHDKISKAYARKFFSDFCSGGVVRFFINNDPMQVYAFNFNAYRLMIQKKYAPLAEQLNQAHTHRVKHIAQAVENAHQNLTREYRDSVLTLNQQNPHAHDAQAPLNSGARCVNDAPIPDRAQHESGKYSCAICGKAPLCKACAQEQDFFGGGRVCEDCILESAALGHRAVHQYQDLVVTPRAPLAEWRM